MVNYGRQQLILEYAVVHRATQILLVYDKNLNRGSIKMDA
jgi:hypothetical protein